MSLPKGYEKKYAEPKVAENIKDKQTKFEYMYILTDEGIVLQPNLTRDVLPLTYGRIVNCSLLCIFPFNHMPFGESSINFLVDDYGHFKMGTVRGNLGHL